MLQPLDIAVLLAARLLESDGWTYELLASRMGSSSSQLHRAMSRCRAARLVVGPDRHVRTGPLLHLLEHGVRWVYYAELGPLVRGVATAHSAPVMSELVSVSGGDAVVWPHAEGADRGQALEPLYPGAPLVRDSWPRLYDVLSVLDSLRVGRRREAELAMTVLRRELGA